MKTKKKILVALALVGCAILLVAGSIAGTMAYLKSTPGTVTNTFTVGKVVITLNETKVDEYGDAVENADPVTANSYKLIPGHTYTKDPTIHVESGSEACWLFVKVVNGISAIEDGTTIATQMTTTHGWTALEGVDNVYYKEHAKDDAADVKVFETFKLKNDAAVEDYEDASISVTAYAIQSDGFADAKAAWTAGGFN